MSLQQSTTSLRRMAVSILSECIQLQTDVEHWNNHVRHPGQKPIQFDPDGQIRAARAAAENALATLR